MVIHSKFPPLPLVSIIVPVYNSEKTIDRCVLSLINQTYKLIEIILINDGSNDRSGQICDSYSISDTRIKVYHKINEGVSIARNWGISKAQGEFLLFVDSDDFLSLEACEILLQNQILLDPDCVIFGFNQLSGTIWAPQENKHYLSLNEFKEDYAYWLNTELLSSSVNKLYKKSKLDDNFPPRMSFGEDLVFSLNYLKNCDKILFLTETLYQHDNLNESSLSHSFDLARFHDIEIIQKNILDFAINKEDVKIHSKYVRDCVRLIRACLGEKQIPLAKKKQILYEWVSHSYFRSLRLSNYMIDWRNRLMVYFMKLKCIAVSYLIVNGKRMLMCK